MLRFFMCGSTARTRAGSRLIHLIRPIRPICRTRLIRLIRLICRIRPIRLMR
ncbi:hypothetical protein ACH47C_18875 [Streptomyces rishiriensis]|uniref:hypothetical protein n=1 Tax=Streptomyces rishiriensis TaxID=68264 RepID=UPI00131EED75|nr:hypothetical protein [Streptomyces rishiriensis]